MVWDDSLPANATKIRNYPTVLTDNFSAIEQGDITLKHWQVNFIERNAVPGAPPPANDPTRTDDTMIVFSKQNSNSRTDLFIMDDRAPSGNIIQLTEDGRLGGQTTNVSLDNFTFDAGTTDYNEKNIINAYGRYDFGGGSAVAQFGCTMVGSGGNTLTVTFTPGPRTDANYVVVATAQGSTSYRVDSQLSTGFVIVALGSPTFFNFMVCGNL